MRWLKNAFALVKEAFQGWMEDGSLELGAALSYYTAFSLAPLLVVAIAIASLVFGRQAVEAAAREVAPRRGGPHRARARAGARRAAVGG